MGLKVVVESLEQIGAQFHELYTEQNGQYVLTGVEGMKTQADIDRLQSALTKERNDHKAIREKFKPFEALDPTDVLGKLDRFTELEQLAAGKVDETKINELVEGRVKSRLSPVERELANARSALQERENLITTFQQRETQRAIGDAVRSAAVKAKIIPEAMDDAMMLADRMFEVTEDNRVVTKDGVGVTPGVDATVWLTELQAKRPHWWGTSVGGGSRGSQSGGRIANPWSADGWNMTEQGRMFRENPTQAAQMAAAAGTVVGGKRPTK